MAEPLEDRYFGRGPSRVAVAGPRQARAFLLAVAAVWAALIAGDLAGRLLPASWLYNRGMDYLVLHGDPGRSYPASLHLELDECGDLLRIGRLPPRFCEQRRASYTTDERGYRNAGGSPATADVLVFGDSFMAGGGLSDHQTFTAQFARRTGLKVYNHSYSGSFMEMAWAYFASADRLAGAPLRVIVGAVEKTLGEKRKEPSALRSVSRWARRLLDASPLALASRASLGVLRESLRLPVEPANGVSIGRLARGGTMVLDLRARRPAQMTVIDDVMKLRSMLGSRTELVMLLVPNKADVYATLLSDLTPPPAAPPESRLDALAAALAAHGVKVVNLRPLMRAEAARREKAGNRPTYWLDDSHWNEAGVALAVDEVVRAIGASTPPEGGGRRAAAASGPAPAD